MVGIIHYQRHASHYLAVMRMHKEKNVEQENMVQIYHRLKIVLDNHKNVMRIQKYHMPSTKRQNGYVL